MIEDVTAAVKASLGDVQDASSESAEPTPKRASVAQIHDFNKKAMGLLRREEAYPKAPQEQSTGFRRLPNELEQSRTVLSLVGYAPQERRLFSSLSVPDGTDLSEASLPAGLTTTQVFAASPHEREQSLGELFGPPRTLLPLQPPKQPKTQAKGNALDFYHPELADTSKYRSNSYFAAKLSSGHFLDYSHASPATSARAKHHERAQSLAGKKPSALEQEVLEMDTLFRGAFSSFAPCKDDTAATVPANVAGRLWWQKTGRAHFQNMIEVEYLGGAQDEPAAEDEPKIEEIDEKAVQEAIDNWDESMVDPTLDEFIGAKREDSSEKEVDEILDEVSDLIQTLSSYQRIRNLTLPNSSNRQTSDPVAGDMLANSGPQPSEEEHTTYLMLKSQLALIVKTLPPYAVTKLNGDQLDDLLISTKVEISTAQFRGVMEEDDMAIQARLRAQQQQQQQQQMQQQQAAQVNVRPPSQRTPSISYQNHYTPQNHQYGTPSRTPAAAPSMPFYPQGGGRNYQQNYPPQRNFSAPSPHPPRPPPPNQYQRSNGYPTQYATQLAKAQTPYGHQNMQYGNQPRPQYGQPQQQQQQGTPQTRFQQYQPQYQQQSNTPSQPNYGGYTNGAGSHQPARAMSPQMPHTQAYSPSPSIPPAPRYMTPREGLASGQNKFSATPSPGTFQTNSVVGYHTVIPEIQQQRILEQAKARVAAHERSAQFADKNIAQSTISGLAGIGLGGSSIDRLAAARASISAASQPKPPTPVGQQRQSMNGTPPMAGAGHALPYKVTPVPVPVIPGHPQQHKPSI
jgi:hypothetical protein